MHALLEPKKFYESDANPGLRLLLNGRFVTGCGDYQRQPSSLGRQSPASATASIRPREGEVFTRCRDAKAGVADGPLQALDERGVPQIETFWEGNVKRLTALVVAVLASSLLVHAQQLPSGTKTHTFQQSVQQVEKAPSAIEPASLVGLTKPQVAARIGKPSAAFDTIWNYKQPKGTLHVRFSRHGIVSGAQIDVEPRSSAKG
jgi:hypothetical protein